MVPEAPSIPDKEAEIREPANHPFMFHDPGNGRRTIGVCAGIGDNIWLIQKLVNAGESFNWRLAGDEPRRGHQIFELLPKSLSTTIEYGTFSSAVPLEASIQMKYHRWSDIEAKNFYLSINDHVGEGRRIETFFPDLATSFKIDWQTSLPEKLVAKRLLPKEEGRVYIGLYGSSYSSLRAWGFWKAPEWMILARRFRKFLGDRVTFVVIGANFDIDLGKDLVGALHAERISVIPMLGFPLGVVTETMKRLDYFFSFPSGLGMLAASVDCPMMMFYPPHLPRLRNSWAAPEAIESKRYRGQMFCEPEEAFRWTLTEFKPHDRW
jgi:hypothetical protein